jgi:hypothetical protein
LVARHALHPFRSGWAVSYRSIIAEVMWSLIGVFTTHVQTRGYVYVTTSLAGLAEPGAINAVGVLFRPARTLMSAWGRSVRTHLSSLIFNRQIEAFDRALLAALAVATAGSAAVGRLAPDRASFPR